MPETAEARDVILRDGTTLRLRPPTAADTDALVSFFQGLSVRSRFLRFHGLAATGRQMVAMFVDPDWAEKGSLAGCLGEGDAERIVALGSYARLRDPKTAEAAFVVADDFQRRGIGTRLLEQLAEAAAEHGIESFVAEVLPENRNMLAVFENVGFRATRGLEGGVYEVRFPIAATETYRERVDERDHVAVTASLQGFFRPRTVAVIGASARRGSIGGELFRNVLEADFQGAAFPVNRKGEPVAGVKAYATIEEIPERDRPRRRLPSRRHRARRRRVGAAQGRARALRHLRRLRRDRPGGHRAPGEAARAGAGARRPARRAELPRHRLGCGEPERDVRTARLPDGTDRLLLAVRRARACAARARRGARAGPLRLRLDREQGGRLLERPARVLGGRLGDRPRSALPRVVREPAQVRPDRTAARSREADPGDEERRHARRAARGGVAHRRARRLGGGGRGALPASGRDPRQDARRAARRRGAPLLPARAARPPGRRADERGRARHPLRRRLRVGRARAGAARRGDEGEAAGVPARRGERRQPGGHARLGDR